MHEDPYKVLLTTDGGLENIVAEEVKEKARNYGFQAIEPVVKPYGLLGQVLLPTSIPLKKLWPLLISLHSIHHILQLIDRFLLSANEPFVTLRSKLWDLKIPEMEKINTYRITTKRSGDHHFSSMDVERVAGAIMGERYQKKVSLENFDYNLRVDVVNSYCLVGKQLTLAPLSHRFNRVYLPRVSIKTTVAYAMVHLAGLKNDKGPMLDPFCGAGTIMLEAVNQCPWLEIYGCDISEEAIRGTLQNANKAGVAGKFHVRLGDAYCLSRLFPTKKFKSIIANPPYGLKMARQKNFRRFYEIFLKEAFHKILPEGKLVIMVWKYKIFEKSLRNAPYFKKVKMVRISRPGIYLYIYVLEVNHQRDL